MAATHEVLRRFNAAGGVVKPGQQVDASGWRNTDLLVDQRYLKPLPVVIVQQDKGGNRGNQPSK